MKSIRVTLRLQPAEYHALCSVKANMTPSEYFRQLLQKDFATRYSAKLPSPWAETRIGRPKAQQLSDTL